MWYSPLTTDKVVWNNFVDVGVGQVNLSKNLPLLLWHKATIVQKNKFIIFPSLLTDPPSYSCHKNVQNYTFIVNPFASLIIIIINFRNDLIFLMVSCMFCLFYFQVLEKPDLEILKFWTFVELAILDWISLFSLSPYTISTCNRLFYLMYIIG